MNRVEKGIKAGKTRQQVFPKLNPLSAEISGEGLTVKVKLIKLVDALPVRLVRNGDDGEVDAAAVREVDLQKKFHWSPFDLADKLSISRPRATALRGHLGIDENPDCLHVFEFGSQKHPRLRHRPHAHARGYRQLGHGCDMEVARLRAPAPRAPTPAAPTLKGEKAS